MKKFNSFAKAKKFVQLFLEGTFGEKSLVLNDMEIDMKGYTYNHIMAYPRYLAIRKMGTEGLYLTKEKAEEALKDRQEPYCICEFAFEPTERVYTVKLIKYN